MRVEVSSPGKEASAHARAAVPSCTLNDEGLERQRERHARLAPGVARLERDGEALVVDFDSGFDRRALEELIEVERQCCPFFQFDFDERAFRLTVTVREPERRPALDAIAAQLRASN